VWLRSEGGGVILVEEKGGRAPQLLVIRQTDHAFLAGFFAREWGNERFQRPQPNGSFCLAVAEHDNGWTDWELQPALDPKTHLPFSFMSVPTAQHIAIYQKGIERLVKVDHYAGLLACAHTSALYDRARATMPGFSAKYVRAEETHLTNDFVQQLRLQQLRLKVDLRANVATKPFLEDRLVNANVGLLEVLDRLSLYFCLNAQQDTTIEAVPVNDSGEEADLYLHFEGAGVTAIASYPFRREPLAFSIMARRIPKRIYSSDADFQKTLSAAAFFPIHFTLRERRAGNLSKVAGV
jgi:hypothetical protein